MQQVQAAVRLYSITLENANYSLSCLETPWLLSQLLPYELSVMANNLLKVEKTTLLLTQRAAVAF